MTENPYARDPAATPSMTPDQERAWSTGLHGLVAAATVLSAGTLGFVAALAVYLVYRDRGPFLRHYAANAMNIQLNALLWFLVGLVLVFVLVGFVVLFLVPVVAVLLHVLCAVKANNGEWHNPPLTIRFIR